MLNGLVNQPFLCVELALLPLHDLRNPSQLLRFHLHYPNPRLIHSMPLLHQSDAAELGLEVLPHIFLETLVQPYEGRCDAVEGVREKFYVAAMGGARVGGWGGFLGLRYCCA
jgi:hypothetical protein